MEDYKEKAKELLEKLNQDGIEKYNYTDDALDLIRKYDCENGNFDIVDDIDIECIVESEMKKGGWERVACFLANAELRAPYGYRIDAYGNLQNIVLDDIKLWLEDIIND